jgi:hypothetical protein
MDILKIKTDSRILNTNSANQVSNLHHAITQGFFTLVQTLLHSPAISVSVKKNQGKSPLQHAFSCNVY